MTKEFLHRAVFVGQAVDDIRVPNQSAVYGAPYGQLAENIAAYRRELLELNLISKDKVNARLAPKAIKDGVLFATLRDGMMTRMVNGVAVPKTIECELPLGLPDDCDITDVRTIFSKVPGVLVGKGGNVVYNMAVDAILSADEDMEITVCGSADPMEVVPRDIAEAMKERYRFYQLPGIDNRAAYQFRFHEKGETGTFGINTEPDHIDVALETILRESAELRERFKVATSFISSGPIFEQVRKYGGIPHHCTINGPSGHRSVIAAAAHSTNTMLPQNAKEAKDCYQVLLEQTELDDLRDIKAPEFHSPLTSSEQEIHWENLYRLDRSLNRLTSGNPPYRSGSNTVGFSYPITFGKKGGLVVGSGHEHIACFTTIPNEEAEKFLMESYGVPDKMEWEMDHEMGTGDASAMFSARFNLVDPIRHIVPHVQGRELNDSELKELACVCFVGLGNRVAGNFVARARESYWANWSREGFQRFCDDNGKLALELAEKALGSLESPKLIDVSQYGMQLLVWKLGGIREKDVTKE